MSSAGCGHHVFTPFFFALFQGSPLKRETCSRSQRFAPRSDPGPCPAGSRRGQDMPRFSCLLSGLAFILSTTSTEGFARAGTIYKVAYRQVYRQVPQHVASCCPGWSRASSHALSCNTGAVPERRPLHLPRPLLLPTRLDGALLPDRQRACWSSRESREAQSSLCQCPCCQR
ncbi:Epidermal growth factor-like protein 7 isoform X1 [Aix galericulata]|nr:Epidermal growth factor-like protein 7 isoform X1 [Aix galericulata]